MRRLLLLVVALIVYGSLYPWHFDFSRAYGVNPLAILLHSPLPVLDKFTFRDTAINILLYIPLGLFALLSLARGKSRAAAAGAALVFGVALSASVEMLQIYVPTRLCSLADVITNGIGTAAGVVLGLLFQPQLAGLSRRKSGHHGAGPIALLVSWLGYQLFPFFPILSRTRLRAEVAAMGHLSSVSAVEIWAHAAEWFVAGVLLEAIFGRIRTVWLVAAMLCLPLRLIVATRSLAWQEVLGAALALLLWVAVPAASRTRWGLWFLAIGIVLRELTPFHFGGAPHAFSWVPFLGTFQSEREAAAIVLCRKAFEYGGLVWLVRLAAGSYLIAGVSVAMALGVLEAAQRYQPGRSPEITDPFLALVLAYVLWRLDRLGRNPGGTQG